MIHANVKIFQLRIRFQELEKDFEDEQPRHAAKFLNFSRSPASFIAIFLVIVDEPAFSRDFKLRFIFFKNIRTLLDGRKLTAAKNSIFRPNRALKLRSLGARVAFLLGFEGWVWAFELCIDPRTQVKDWAMLVKLTKTVRALFDQLGRLSRDRIYFYRCLDRR